MKTISRIKVIEVYAVLIEDLLGITSQCAYPSGLRSSIQDPLVQTPPNTRRNRLRLSRISHARWQSHSIGS